jgi:hypothetical protein
VAVSRPMRMMVALSNLHYECNIDAVAGSAP